MCKSLEDAAIFALCLMALCIVSANLLQWITLTLAYRKGLIAGWYFFNCLWNSREGMREVADLAKQPPETAGHFLKICSRLSRLALYAFLACLLMAVLAFAINSILNMKKMC